MGMRGFSGEGRQIGGQRYLSLNSIRGVTFTFDDRDLVLAITTDPKLLETKTIDLLPPRRGDVLRPKDSSAFLNYGLSYFGDQGGGAQGYNAAGELGLRLDDYLVTSDFAYTAGGGRERGVRLMSTLTRDWRDSLQRLAVGDFFASSGLFGSTLNLGGLSFSKRYGIDPYLITQPMAGFSGAVGLPSEAVIYLNGVPIRSERLPPGQFQIENLNYYGGARDIQVVVRDNFGREQSFAYAYYFTPNLLREGFEEYSYNAGWLRQNYGLDSNDYGAWAVSAQHRYGVYDWLTLGARAEAQASRYNAGFDAALRIGSLGVAALNGSRSDDRLAGAGQAGQMSYSYQNQYLNVQLSGYWFSRNYLPLMGSVEQSRPKSQFAVGIGYGSSRLGNINAGYTTGTQYLGNDRQTLSLSYSRQLFGTVSLFANASHIQELGADDNLLLVGLSYFPGEGLTVGYQHQGSKDLQSDLVFASKNVPFGEGWSYRVSADANRGAGGDNYAASPFVQYQGRYGVYNAGYQARASGDGAYRGYYQLGTAGSLVYVDGSLAFSRPVYDSFALVKVGGIEGVHVFQNNQLIGATDADGELFLPSLGSYVNNQIAIEDKDIPIEYTLPNREKYVAPPLRGGVLVDFNAVRIQAISGKLFFRANGKTVPAEFAEVRLPAAGLTFSTGRKGSFYLENVKPGRYKASMSYRRRRCDFDLVVPDREEAFLKLGEVVCESD